MLINWLSQVTVLDGLNYFGVFVFAISGALAGARKDMDMFGLVAVALLPGIGGGTARDLMLDVPVFWLVDPVNLLAAALGGVITIPFAAPLMRSRMLKWFDAVGLALFCVAGAAVALSLGYGLAVTVVMGTVTATLGGVLRDVVCNEVPLVLQKEIYALAAMLGALAYWLLIFLGADAGLSLILAAVMAFLVRAAGIYFDLSLPSTRV